jgi:hypothetical protein
MGATIYRPNDLALVNIRVSWGAIDTNLTSIAVGVGTVQSTPVPLFTPSPILGFGVCDSLFDLLLGMSRPIGHLTTRNLVAC